MVFASIILLLVLLNGLFVAAEFAIISASRASLEAAAEKGDRIAARLYKTKIDPLEQDRFIATAQLGITLASLGLGAYGEHNLAHMLEAPLEGWLGESSLIGAHLLATVIAMTTLTYLHIVIGEMVPKSMALSRSLATARVIAPFMWVFQWVMSWFVWLLNATGNAVLRLFRINRAEGSLDQHFTREELELVVQESTQEGMLQSEEAQMLQDLLEFGSLSAGDVMVPRVRIAGIPSGTTWEGVKAILSERPHTRYPVYEGDLDHIVGVAHVKDLLRNMGSDKFLEDACARQVPFVPETALVNDVMLRMRENRTQLVVVIDEYGGTAGIVTIDDIYEEVVGQLPGEPAELEERDGVIIAAGTVRLEEIEELVGRSLEHEEVDTVSGLVLALLNRPPNDGDVVEYQGLRFEVLEHFGHGVSRCAITPLPDPDPED